MELTTLSVIVASLRVDPNRTHFFRYERISLSCGEPGYSSKWRVKRNTSGVVDRECAVTWGNMNGSQCTIRVLYEFDSGVYWCESRDGERSVAVNITVTGGPVILESPVLPVQEGDDVTLRCMTSDATSSVNLTVEFYKEGLLIGRSSTGDLTIHKVCKSDEGVYKCNIARAGESPDSWLAVRAGRPASVHPPTLTYSVLTVVGVCVVLASVILLCLQSKHKGETKRNESYADVFIAQEAPPRRNRGNTEMDTEPTFYSTIKPGAT